MAEVWGRKAGVLNLELQRLVDSLLNAERAHKSDIEEILRALDTEENNERLGLLLEFFLHFAERSEIPTLKREKFACMATGAFLAKYHSLHPEKTTWRALRAAIAKTARRKWSILPAVLFGTAMEAAKGFPVFRSFATAGQLPPWWSVGRESPKDTDPTPKKHDCWCKGRSQPDWRQVCHQDCVLLFLECYTFTQSEMSAALGTGPTEAGLRFCRQYWCSQCVSPDDDDDPAENDLTLLNPRQRAVRSAAGLLDPPASGWRMVLSAPEATEPESMVAALWSDLERSFRRRVALGSAAFLLALAGTIAFWSLSVGGTGVVRMAMAGPDRAEVHLPKALEIDFTKKTLQLSENGDSISGPIPETWQPLPGGAYQSLVLLSGRDDAGTVGVFSGSLIVTNASAMPSPANARDTLGVRLIGGFQIGAGPTNSIDQTFLPTR